MDILKYIDRVNTNFDKKPEPRYNMKKYFMGGSVTTPKRGLVDEPGSYSQEKLFLMKDPKLADKMRETKRAKFRATPVGERLQWIANNGKNYENPEKFIKSYEKHFKHKLGSAKDVLFNKEGKIALGSIDGLQNTGKTGAQGGDLFIFKKGFSEAEIFKASIIQNNPKVQKQFKNLFKNIANNVSEYQELGPEGMVAKLKKDGGNLLNDFDFLESYNPSPDAKQTYGGVHSGVTRRSLINLGIPDKHITAFQSVRAPVLSLKNILTNLKTNPKGFGASYGISPTTAKKLTNQLDNFMKGYGEASNIVKEIDKDLGNEKFKKVFGGVNFEHTLAKSFGKDYKYLPRNYLLKGQFTTKNFNLFKRDVFDLPLIKLMKQYEAGKIPAEKVQAFINDFNKKTNNYADFSFDTKKGKLAYTDNKVKYDLSRYNNPGVAKQELIKNIELTMSDEFQKGFKGTVGAKEQLKLFKSKEATEIRNLIKAIGCPNNKAMGGRIGFKDGTNCFEKGDEVIRSAKPAKGAQFRNFVKLGQVLAKTGKTAAGAADILLSVGAGAKGLGVGILLETGFAMEQASKGQPGLGFSQTVLGSLYNALVPDEKEINLENRLLKSAKTEEERVALQNLIDFNKDQKKFAKKAKRFNYLYNAPEFESEGVDLQKLEDELYEMYADLQDRTPKVMNKEVSKVLSDVSYRVGGEGRNKLKGLYGKIFGDAQLNYKSMDQNVLGKSYYDAMVPQVSNVMGMPMFANTGEIQSTQQQLDLPTSYQAIPEELDDIYDMGRLGASSGGIASGPPPEKGPQSQGLAYLMKNGKR